MWHPIKDYEACQKKKQINDEDLYPEFIKSSQNCLEWPLMPVIPALWETEAGRLLELRSSRPVWATGQNPISSKNKKISPAWWCVPVIPATQEAVAGELPEPRRRRLQ